MIDLGRKRARKEQTLREFERLKQEVELWSSRRQKEDKLNQYKTQVNAISNLVRRAAEFLEAELNKINLNNPLFEFYEDCRQFDLRVVWLRKVWSFYKDKFDQRDDDQLRALLLAADEVVWSCYQQAFRQASAFGMAMKQRPVPLPFVEISYSPESFPSELVPYGLKPSETGFLQDLMNRLPIPLVSLPQSCVRAPWWLVYVGHEVGHHIQYALADKGGFVPLFKKQIENVAKMKCGGSEDVEKWGGWGKEIFADVFSVLTMGQWAVFAMVELELQKADKMLERRAQYPAPAIRLHLLAHTANSLGLDGTGALRGLNIEEMMKGNPQAERDYSFVDDVVKIALELEISPNVTLATLVDLNKDNYASALRGWPTMLSQPNPVVPVISDPNNPRFIASAILVTWYELAVTDEEERRILLQNLADKALKLIVASREPGDRTKSINELEIPDFGRELAEQLMTAEQQQLEI